MAILLFSLVFLVGLVPSVYCLDRLFAINFAKAARARSESKDVFWQPRGIADTGAGKVEAVSRRPIAKGLGWLLKTPGTFADDPPAGVLLWAYRISALLVLTGFFGILLFLFIF